MSYGPEARRRDVSSDALFEEPAGKTNDNSKLAKKCEIKLVMSQKSARMKAQ